MGEVKANVNVVGLIDLPKIDVKKYIGMKAKIDRAEVYEGTYGYYVKVETAPLDVIDTKEKAIEIRGSAILGLQNDIDGRIGWGEGTKTDKALKYYNVKHFSELVGKTVLVIGKQGKDNQTFLGIDGMQ